MVEHQIALVLTHRFNRRIGPCCVKRVCQKSLLYTIFTYLLYTNAVADRWRMDEGGTVAKKKRHSKMEIAAKLAQASDLATQGKLQGEIARTLGVSVMTLHRWRKALPVPEPTLVATAEVTERGRTRRIAELQLENSRLRRLVTDVLLEKIKLEEAVQRQNFRRNGRRRESR
jgi:putative transposase